MPEFTIARIKGASRFQQAYVTAACWVGLSVCPSGEPEEYAAIEAAGIDPNWVRLEDLHPDTVDELLRDAGAFEQLFKGELEWLSAHTDADDEQNGADLWLTRNGHGAGFWEMDHGLKPGDEYFEFAEICLRKLDAAAKMLGERSLYFDASDNLLHMEG